MRHIFGLKTKSEQIGKPVGIDEHNSSVVSGLGRWLEMKE